MLTGKRVLIIGGTGTLGRALLLSLLSGTMGRPARITLFSRDEAKQHELRLRHVARRRELGAAAAEDPLRFQIGDVRSAAAVAEALRHADVVFHAAALKQVPNCEYFPGEAVATNIGGARNIVHAIRSLDLPVATVVGLSTDKAVNPVNVMGMTKALQERLFVAANMDCPRTRFVIVRYGNVLASRGSVVPLFRAQIAAGGPVTVTAPDMTRFLVTPEAAIGVIRAALAEARPGEIYLPKPASARVVDIAAALIGGRPIAMEFTGIRPGEKLHETLVGEEESPRLFERGGCYVVGPMLPELATATVGAPPLARRALSSADCLMSAAELSALLGDRRPMPEELPLPSSEPPI